MIPFILAMSLFPFSHPICPCHIQDREVQEEIDRLYEFAKREPSLPAVAAPQIGIQKRILLIYLKEFINPEIVSEEGDPLLLRWYDREGNLFTEEVDSPIRELVRSQINRLDGIAE